MLHANYRYIGRADNVRREREMRAREGELRQLEGLYQQYTQNQQHAKRVEEEVSQHIAKWDCLHIAIARMLFRGGHISRHGQHLQALARPPG